ncbi:MULTISPECIES: hypothetical protein [unclassified Rhizobium]|uniref:hypothetical protein n=1 Tax=unclassified Rhizobium TaxID=2613769 RepID=UPI00104F7BDD|nr:MULTISPECIES: hypothetical protein [unclassified Rhizobium]TCS00620.1 hypothetical protein EV281_10752 [Rhizobium sp. BK418]
MGASPRTDHDKIREWIEARGGHPARMKSGLVGVDFSKQENTVENISWDEFFRVLDASKKTFLHQDAKIARN